MIMFGAILFMAAFIKCCAVHTPSSNPKRKKALRITDTLRRPADTLRRKASSRIIDGGRVQSGKGYRDHQEEEDRELHLKEVQIAMVTTAAVS